jgi:hypothetical protein
MNIKDLISDKKDQNLYLFNNSYYNNVYKKTERISCAVFLITEKSNGQNSDLVRDAQQLSLNTLLSVIRFLSTDHTPGVLAESIRNLASLRSLLLLLAAVRVTRQDFAEVIIREIDSAIQSLYTYYRDEAPEALFSVGEHDMVSPKEERRRAPSRSLAPTTQAPASSVSRRDTILSIIRTKGSVSIKDISDVVTDCSEKTIQRELMDMIKDNIVIKEGERRWSKYKLVQAIA